MSSLLTRALKEQSLHFSGDKLKLFLLPGLFQGVPHGALVFWIAIFAILISAGEQRPIRSFLHISTIDFMVFYFVFIKSPEFVSSDVFPLMHKINFLLCRKNTLKIRALHAYKSITLLCFLYSKYQDIF